MPVCCPCFWLTSYRSSAPTTFSMGSSNFLDQVTELRETFYSLDCQFIIKGYNSGTTRWKRCLGKGMGSRCGAFMPFLSMPLSPNLYVFTNTEAVWAVSFWVFMEALLYRQDCWPLVIELSFQSLSHLCSWRWGEGWKGLKASIAWLVPLVTNPPILIWPRGITKSPPY